MLHQITLVTIYTSFRQTLHLKSIWLFVKVSQTSRQNVVYQNVIDRKDWHVSYLPAPFTQNVCLFNASNDDVTSTHLPQNDLCQNIFSTLLHHQNVINKRHIIWLWVKDVIYKVVFDKMPQWQRNIWHIALWLGVIWLQNMQGDKKSLDISLTFVRKTCKLSFLFKFSCGMLTKW